MAAPFRDWTDHSNGRVEITCYRPGSTYPADLPEPQLRRDRQASAVPPSTGIELLFSSSVASGAYSHGPGGAYSRLRTWEAVSGIVDHDWPSALDELAAAAEGAAWITVQPDDPWFDDVAWDIWMVIAAVDRVVVLAVTDTD